MSRARAALCAAAVTAVSLTTFLGCGIGEQDGVERISPDDLAEIDATALLSVPADSTESTLALPRPSTTSVIVSPTTGPTTTTVRGTPATMYFIEGDVLVPVEVDVPLLSLRAYLDTLESGPPPTAIEEGVRSAIPRDLVRSVDVRLDSITIDLSGELFSTVDTQDQQLLIAQIVLSVTNLPDYPGTDRDLPHLARVRFSIDGVPTQVFRRDNTLTQPGEFVTMSDYELLLNSEQGARSNTSEPAGTSG